MKKIVLSLVAGLFLFSAQAQRNVDLKSTLHTPTAGQVIKSGQTFNVSFAMTNIGTDAIKTSDTLIIWLQMGTSMLSGTQALIKPSKDLATGDSIPLSLNNLNLQGGNAAQGVNFCAAAFVINKSDNDSAHDVDNTNNIGCNSVDYDISTAINNSAVYELGSAKVAAVPNPANSYTQLTYDLSAPSNVNLSIFDVNGKLVKQVVNQHQNAGVYIEGLETTDLNKGIYFVKLALENRVSTTKLVIVR